MCRPLLLLFIVLCLAPGAAAQSAYEQVAEIPLAGWPSALVVAPDGYLYGTICCSFGGSGGVFRMARTGEMTWFRDFFFNGPSGGRRPAAPLLRASNGYFYGTTSLGGASDRGTVFRIAASGVFTTLHDFTAAEGGQPRTALIEGVDGHLYGTTSRGGASDSGTVFRIDLDGTLTTLCSVGPGASALIQVGGALYGTASGGGTSGLGVVFRLLLDSTLTVLHSFTLEEGSVPRAPLVLGSDGALYGTTTGGGAYGYGAAFRLAVDGATRRFTPSTPATGGVPSRRSCLRLMAISTGAPGVRQVGRPWVRCSGWRLTGR